MAHEFHFTRHGAATQERRTSEQLAALEALPSEEFAREILAMNMRQGLVEQGQLQATDLGHRIGNVLLPNAATIVALVGPYRRHQESAEIALSVPELADRTIHVVRDDRLAERSRGRLDASIWPARKLRDLPPEHPYGDQFAEKEQHPAMWRPPEGENYAAVNIRIDAALEDHGLANSAHPIVVFGSGEMALARLKLSDEEYRRGTLTESGRHMSLLALNNAGIVTLSDPYNSGGLTHWQVHDPVEIPRGEPYHEPQIIHSQLNQY